jgi:hypothetical protein
MIDKPPRIVLEPRHTRCTSQGHWDEESLLVSVTLDYEDRKEPAKKVRLADTIDEDLGIGQRGFRVVLGDMDILLDSNGRMRSLELRKSPNGWEPFSLRAVPRDLQAAFVRFMVNYDANSIASYRVPIRVLKDRSRREVAFAFADFAASHWAAIADHLLVGLTADGYLSEFRVLDTDLAFK